jgi:ABC-type antimicrobial peptide transport system permease subunit
MTCYEAVLLMQLNNPASEKKSVNLVLLLNKLLSRLLFKRACNEFNSTLNQKVQWHFAHSHVNNLIIGGFGIEHARTREIKKLINSP